MTLWVGGGGGIGIITLSPPPPSPMPPAAGMTAGTLHARTDFGKITCPIVGMLVKNGGLVPDANGMINRQQTVDAFMAAGFPAHIVTPTTNGNFQSIACPSCPLLINPFEMNTITTPFGVNPPSVSNEAQEHFRSTGIRDTTSGTPNVPKFNAVETSCLGTRSQWTRADVDCFTAFWDRNPGCPGPSSNDVNTDKTHPNCNACDTAMSNPDCRSALQITPEFLFEMFAVPMTSPLAYRTISKYNFRKIWIDLDDPRQTGGGGGAPPPPSPSPPPPHGGGVIIGGIIGCKNCAIP
jgi:hypothetical protein